MPDPNAVANNSADKIVMVPGMGTVQFPGTMSDDEVNSELGKYFPSSSGQSNQGRMSVADFAAKIKAKYPDYAGIDDHVLALRILAKYPEYRGTVSFAPAAPTGVQRGGQARGFTADVKTVV